MAKYVFLNISGVGHVNSTLAVVQELVRRGQDVTYFLPEMYRPEIEATGAVFQPYLEERPDVSPQNQEEAVIAFFRVLWQIPQGVVERIRQEQPDVIVYGYLCLWGREVSKQFDVLRVSTRATYASNEHFNLIEQLRTSDWSGLIPGGYETLDLLRQREVAREEIPHDPLSTLSNAFQYAERFNLVFLPRMFQPAAETFDERYVFVGPSLSPRYEYPDFPFDQLDATRPLLYISLGSLFTDRPDFYRQCFAAFADSPWQVVLSIGKHVKLEELGTIPEHFLVASYAPQLSLLSRARLFLTHAGANSIMESIYSGIPMVLYPQQPEQIMNAQRVIELGLGSLLEKEMLSPETLRSVVNEVASNNAFYERAARIQEEVHATGGYQRATDALMQFVASMNC